MNVKKKYKFSIPQWSSRSRVVLRSVKHMLCNVDPKATFVDVLESSMMATHAGKLRYSKGIMHMTYYHIIIINCSIRYNKGITQNRNSQHYDLLLKKLDRSVMGKTILPATSAVGSYTWSTVKVTFLYNVCF